MTNQEYSQLVDHFTDLWRNSPQKYQRAIDVFALLGISVLVLAAGIAIALILFMHVWTVIAGCIILYSIITSIFYRPGPPEGINVNRADAPLLFEDVDSLARQLGARKCDGIRLDFDFNAAAVQYHRWGIVGPVRNYVQLGMPLLDAMGRQHIRSTIAHEIGHLMLKHGIKARRSYAMARMYRAICENVSGFAWYLLGPFANWYLPRFYARLQPLSLRSEFEADALEVRVSSPKIAAESLCLLTVGVDRMEAAIKAFSEQEAVDEAEALADKTFEYLRSWPQEYAKRTIDLAMKGVTDTEGTHPALAERLQAIGSGAVSPEPVLVSASEEYFGAKRKDFARSAANWYLEQDDDFSGYVKSMREARLKVANLRERIEQGDANQQEVEEYVRAVGLLHGPVDARPIAEAFIDRFPSSAALYYYRGISRLDEDDASAVADLQMAAHLDEGSQAAIFEAIYRSLLARGRSEEAAEFRSKRDGFLDAIEARYDSRRSISKEQDYEPSRFNDEEIEKIRLVLSRVSSIDCAYLARRITSDSPVVLFDLAVFPRKRRVIADGDALTRRIESDLADIGKAKTVFFGPWLREEVRARLFAIDGSKIYERDSYLAKKKEESNSASS